METRHGIDPSHPIPQKSRSIRSCLFLGCFVVHHAHTTVRLTPVQHCRLHGTLVVVVTTMPVLLTFYGAIDMHTPPWRLLMVHPYVHRQRRTFRGSDDDVHATYLVLSPLDTHSTIMNTHGTSMYIWSEDGYIVEGKVNVGAVCV